MVDTCAGEFAAHTPYFYATYDTEESGGEDEALEFIGEDRDKPTVIVLGSGPIRIGQGIEFDYASVHCVWSLKKLGYEVVIVNNNPETVSTDFDTGDRLYFEPLSPEDVLDIIEIEKPIGVVVAFGGQTAIKLTKTLAATRFPFWVPLPTASTWPRTGSGLTSCWSGRHQASQGSHHDDHGRGPEGSPGSGISGADAALLCAGRPEHDHRLYCDEDIQEYMAIILTHKHRQPGADRQVSVGIEIEVDAICDGEDILIPGIMEHVERTGIHSGDSIAVYPAWDIDDDMSANGLSTATAPAGGTPWTPRA